MTKQRFGGNWTIEKLGILSDYLNFYITALKGQPFDKIYIDAFAGTGHITVGDDEEIIEGSVRLALNAVGKFDRYIFIEKKKKYAQELNSIVHSDYPELSERVTIINQDCNVALQEICARFNRQSGRAVLFLDPYATEVRWETLQAIAATKAIDVWYLFPLSAVNRLLKKDKQIDPTWKVKLNMIFGEDGWEQEFYREDPQENLFGGEDFIKEASTESIKKYICKRLETIFPKVSSNPRVLYNTRNSPLFLFCFAVANDNPKAMGLAMKVADHILKEEV